MLQPPTPSATVLMFFLLALCNCDIEPVLGKNIAQRFNRQVIIFSFSGL